MVIRIPLSALLLLLIVAGTARADTLTAAEVVQRGLGRSPAILAARQRTEAAQSALQAAGLLPAPRLEVAPGVGFTNGNAFLTKSFDISGERKARSQAAQGELDVALAQERWVRQQVATQLRIAYFELVRSRRAESQIQDALTLARVIQARIMRRVELGEAPAVQGIRADIETVKLEQERIRAHSEVTAQLATLNRLLGRASEIELIPSDSLLLPIEPLAIEVLLSRAKTQRPELAQAQAQLQVSEGEISLVKARSRPTLSLDLATDFWSLDRRSTIQPLGLQVRYSLPFGIDYSQRAQLKKAQAERSAEEAELDVRQQAVAIEVERAALKLRAARTAALNYEAEVLPRVEMLFAITRKGFDDGLTSFVEVLEAQRSARISHQEYEILLMEALRADLALAGALGENPS